MATGSQGGEPILSASVRVPEHVVYRDFADETVILNLDSGMYHGLNSTAARMLQVLESSSTVSEAIDELATEFDQPRETIERDVVTLCRSLDDRGLIERDAGRDG